MAAYGDLIARMLNRVWRAVPDLVRTVAYVQPASFNPATGLCLATETVVAASAVVLTVRPRDWDLVVSQPGDERALVRANELGSIVPVAGHYFCEAESGLRRDVVWAWLDPTKTFWTLHCQRSLNEDRGDLSAHTTAEDYGDLATATVTEDCQGLL